MSITALDKIKQCLAVMEAVYIRQDLVDGILQYIEYLGCSWYSREIRSSLPRVLEKLKEFQADIINGQWLASLKVAAEYSPASTTAGCYLHIQSVYHQYTIPFYRLSSADLDAKYQKWVDISSPIEKEGMLRLPTNIKEAKTFIRLGAAFLEDLQIRSKLED
jgi:hypothetical protein